MVMAAAAAHAQDDGAAGMREPTTDAEIEAEFNRLKTMAETMSEPMICADLTATPTPLANGDMQYPTKPCRGIEVDVAPDEPTVRDAVPDVVPAMPTRAGTPVTGNPVIQPTLQAPQPIAVQDLNVLQMKRLGQLDAMQGRPINMQNASNLGYLQGYTDGQRMRMQTPGGGFGGYNR